MGDATYEAVSVAIAPEYRRTLREGMSGHEVWAVQINFNNAGYSLHTHGDFGSQLVGAAKDFQTRQKLVVDGIIGLLTQRALALKLYTPFKGEFRTPSGLAKGMLEGESGFAAGCVATHPKSWDLGWTQDNCSLPLRDSDIRNAFDGKICLRAMAKALRTKKDEFLALHSGVEGDGPVTHEFAWFCSILNWNWPAAAYHYALGDIHEWVYTETLPDGTKRSRRMRDEAEWVKRASAGRLRTGFEWADNYVQSKSAYVKEWPA